MYVIEWDGLDHQGNPVGSGIYLYQIQAENRFLATKKLIFTEVGRGFAGSDPFFKLRNQSLDATSN